METRVIYPVNFAIVALLFGIWGDLMLRALPIGINVPLWYIPLIITIPIAYRRHLSMISPTAWLFLALAAGFSVVPLIRDSASLNIICIAAAIFALLIAAAKQTGLLLWAANMSRYVVHLVTMLFASAFTWFKHISAVESWVVDKAAQKNHHTPAVLRGMAASIPFILVFGILFASADAKYERIVLSIRDIDPVLLFTHTFFILLFTWIASTLLFMFYFPSLHVSRGAAGEGMEHKWNIELLIVLFAINMMFLSYVLIQVSYFFGGLEHMLKTENLTIAEYARRGFFESASAAGLVIVILMTFNEIRGTSHTNQNRVFTGLSVILVALTGVVIASGIQRILVYQNVFGLTEDRFYVLAILMWMAGTSLWLTLTLVWDRLRGFIVGAVLLAYASLFAVVCINPHREIAEVNLARAAEGRDLDADYLATLSADASPALYKALPTLSERDQQTIVTAMLLRTRRAEKEDFRSWCLAREALKNTAWEEEYLVAADTENTTEGLQPSSQQSQVSTEITRPLSSREVRRN